MSKHNKTEKQVSWSIGKYVLLFGGACVLTACGVIFASKFSITPQLSLIQKSSEIQFADPYVTMKMIMGDNKEKIVLIDMRSKKDFDSMRFKNTVNAYYPYEYDKEGVAKFVDTVRAERSKFKKVVLLPYSGASTTGEAAANALRRAGITSVFVMRIGWNEMYNLPNLWIPEEKIGELTLSSLIEN